MNSLKNRFWTKLNKRGSEECWDWTGSLVEGYGHIEYEYKYLLAHRVSWEIHNGPIPEGMNILHKCDNRKCCNPDHLYVGTQGDNMGDRAIRNPDNQGGKVSDLGADGILEVRRIYATGMYSLREVAKMLNISKTHVWGIVNHKWGNYTIERGAQCRI